MTTTYEQESLFFASFLTEQIKEYIAGPASLYEKEKQFNAAPAVKYEQENEFFALRSQVFEQLEEFRVTGYLLSETENPYYARGTLGGSELEKVFFADQSSNYLYEQENEYIAGWRESDISVEPTSYGVVPVSGGVNIPTFSITGGRNGYFYSFVLQCPENAFTRSIAIDSQVQLIFYSGGETLADINLFVYSRQSDWQAGNSQQPTSKTITFECRSATAGLDILPDDRGALLIDQSWDAGTKVSEILEDIHPTEIPYTIESVDYTISQKYQAEKSAPIQITAELFAGLWIGPTNSGGLLVKRKMPVRSADLISAEPDFILEKKEYIISESSSVPSVNYYNQVTAATVSVTNRVELRAPEIVQAEGDTSKATIYGYRIPWADFEMKTSLTECSGVLTMNPSGIVEELELTEVVDFEDGEATFPYPIKELKAVDWGCNVSLGTVTPSEDGKLRVEDQEARSLAVEVTCLVRRKKFSITRHENYTVKLWFEDFTGNTSDQSSI